MVGNTFAAVFMIENTVLVKEIVVRWGKALETINKQITETESFYGEYAFTVNPMAEWQLLLVSERRVWQNDRRTAFLWADESHELHHRNQAKQRSFARTVHANQADPIMLAYLKGDIVEQLFFAEADA